MAKNSLVVVNDKIESIKTAFASLSGKPLASAIVAIDRLETIMKSMPGHGKPPPSKHYRGNHIIARESSFPAGTIAIGRVHKYDHISIMLTGHMTIWTPDKGLHDVFGPDVTEAKCGMKRAGFAHTDTRWVCVFGADLPEEADDEEIMEYLTFERYGDYLSFTNKTLIEYKG